MMKRFLSFLLAATLLFSSALIGAAAQPQDTTIPPIALRLHSNLDGVTPDEYTKFADILCDAIDYDMEFNAPVSVADYAGTDSTAPLKAGRTYSVYYSFVPVNGYTLPQTSDELKSSVTCDKGVELISVQVVRGRELHSTVNRSIRVYAVVKVDGNLLQRLFGRIYDLYLKLRAWSLY